MSLEIIECNECCENYSGEELFREKIKKLYQSEENSKALLYVKPLISSRRPDFILIDRDRGIAIIKIKDYDSSFFSSVNALEVNTSDGRTIQNPTIQCEKYLNFFDKLFKKQSILCDENKNLKYKLVSRLVMCNMTDNNLKEVKYFYKNNNVEIISKDLLKNLTLDDVFKNTNENLTNNVFDFIRCIINPELRISQNYRFNLNENNEPTRIIKVLDFEQEKFIKRNIDGHYMVSGVPGSGKTVMLLARALYIAKLHKDWHIKIVCYNNSLANKMKERLSFVDKIFKIDYSKINRDRISVTTFHKLCCEFTKINKKEMEFYGPENYFNKILPMKALENVSRIYDAVLIDEYQDFYDDWIKLCIACCQKHNDKENIFLAGDRLQSIYNTKELSWKQIGINIQGRSKLLKLSYRTGREYINTALEFLKHDQSLSKEIDKFYEGSSNINTCDESSSYKIKFITGYYDEIYECIKKLFRGGFQKEDILILVNDNYDIEKVKRILPDDLQLMTATSKEPEKGKIFITAYHSSKGIECKACFLVDFDKLSSRKNGRKLAYVGMTRPSEILYIHAIEYDGFFNYAEEVRDIAEGRPYKNSEDYILESLYEEF